jgi:hypothetical protein
MDRLLDFLHRFRYWLAPLSFGAGLASFLLIERRAYLAQWLSGLLLLGWLAILAEGAAGRLLRVSPAVLRFGIQQAQQETFFFVLPFFLHTTTWTTGQAAFTVGVGIAALCSMWDPLYYGRIVSRPALYLAFHAFAVFVGTLTMGPILLHLTTDQTLQLAGACVALFSLPALLHLMDRRRASHWILLPFAAIALGASAWLARPIVPPATLWVAEARITDRIDPELREPGEGQKLVTPEQAHHSGLYAFIAIHAPRGLTERVYHRWLQDGREVDRIALQVAGGREQGYRAWSFKRGFPADPRGHWAVQAVTESGQLIGQLEFDIM